MERKRIRLRFSPRIRGGDDVVGFKGVSKRYGQKVLFEDLNLQLQRGERLGIVGPNGTGKTTLLRMITGEESPTTGEMKLGRNISIGYFEQEHRTLNADNTVLDEVWQVRPELEPGQLRSLLGRFLFSGGDVFKKIGSLSGGEQSRAALAKLMLQDANFLLLDEPTNHLDIPSRTVLEEALQQYQGTILIVSHDRYLLNKLVQKLLVIDNGRTKLYLGNYAYYEQRREQARKLQEEKREVRKEAPKKKGISTGGKKVKAETQPSLKEMEILIMEKESLLEQVTKAFGDTKLYEFPEKVKELEREYDSVKRELESLYAEWEQMADSE